MMPLSITTCRLNSHLTGNPDVKFIATVLAQADQQEAAVLASKFRNLHLWGCWWFSNTPSARLQAIAAHD